MNRIEEEEEYHPQHNEKEIYQKKSSYESGSKRYMQIFLCLCQLFHLPNVVRVKLVKMMLLNWIEEKEKEKDFSCFQFFVIFSHPAKVYSTKFSIIL